MNKAQLQAPIITIDATDGKARAGVLHTPHDDVPTPAFMPVGTQGSVKSLDPDDLKGVGANIILGNTYHLYLRPGIDIIESFGGLHRFISWDRPILTDSGGFQGFSLEHLRKITDDGIVFKSHLDGSAHIFTPEATISHEERIGADIIMPLDMCVSSDSDRETVEDAVERTNRWLARCKEAKSRTDTYLFGIVQGGLFSDLRQRSADFVISLGFPGYAVGGLSVGESKEQMYETAAFTTGLLPTDAPRYLMGVGSPEDLVECVACGIDMFDCVLPTRIARNGALFARTGRINIDTARYKTTDGPIEDDCDCYTCQTFSAAYVNHLFRAKELLAYRLASIHNLRFILRLMEDMRSAIIEGCFEQYRGEFHQRFVPPDQKTRHLQKQKWLESLKNSKSNTAP